MTGPHPDAPDNIRQISVEPQLLDNEKRSLGGTRVDILPALKREAFSSILRKFVVIV
jgi:hypothetical protein